MPYALVIGGKGGRRSQAARNVAKALVARGLRVGGFTQRTIELEGGKKRIDLVHARDGRVVPLAHAAVPGADPDACSLSFERAAFDEARRWVEWDIPECDVLVLDALGKLELGGEGHRATLAHALANAPLVVLAVRDDQLVYALESLGLDEPVASYTDGSGAAALEDFVAQVAHAARARSPH
jgi:nucleoside-triphosphatase THEP1